MDTLPNDPSTEKSICFRFPRYEKRSLFTETASLIIPSAVLGIKYFPTESSGELGALFGLFAQPLATLFNTFTSLGASSSIYLSFTLHFLALLFIHAYKKISPRYALALTITIGLLDMLGLKLLVGYLMTHVG